MTGEEKRATLEQVRGHILELESIRAAMEMTESWAQAQPYRMQETKTRGSGQPADRVADGALRLMQLGEKMNEAMVDIAEQIARARAIIAQVPESIDRAILTEHYLNGLSWEQVGAKVGYVERHCRHRRDAALGVTEAENARCAGRP